jgi:hypothetical protein
VAQDNRLVALGAVPDGEKVVHVLFRHEADMPPPEPVPHSAAVEVAEI